jgi:hypothetical protein
MKLKEMKDKSQYYFVTDPEIGSGWYQTTDAGFKRNAIAAFAGGHLQWPVLAARLHAAVNF